MLTLKNVSLRRGKRLLLDAINFTISPRQRVGFIGANGCGKSSLFALLRGEMHIDSGDLYIQPHLSIAHLAQETPALQVPAIEYVIDGDQELRKIQRELVQAEQNNDGNMIAKLHGELGEIDGYSAHARASQLLHGLGFKATEIEKYVAEFSGGWRMRLNLAQALMCRSDILLLDEPTNHLDLDALLWLENWLLKYPGTLLLISHDRDFLDNIVSHIAHIENKKLTVYTGHYSDFENTYAERLAQQQSIYERQVREREKLQKFVDRFRAKASKAKQAQSRVKMLERMEVVAAVHAASPFQFAFREPKKLPNPLLTLENVAAGYADTTIISKITMSIAPGDRIGILGPNGAGKSTFIKIIADELAIKTGSYEKNPALQIGYFAQHQLEQLHMHLTPVQHLLKIAPHETEQQLRDFLGQFGFIGDQALTPVETFSGGEKARLVLALIVWHRPNLLLLDEPTNHFDIEMRESLTLALQEYVGAIIVVSHDRHLLRTTVDTLYLVYDGKIQIFSGDMDDYQKWLKQINAATSSDKKTNKAINSDMDFVGSMSSTSDDGQAKRVLMQQSTKIEKELAKQQNQKLALETALADENIYAEKNKELLLSKLKQQADIDKNIEKLEYEWLELQTQLEGK